MSPRTKKQLEVIRESRKEIILRVALKLFSTKGYFNTSIRQIAKEAEISDGLLYNYFKSKEELMKTVLESAFLLVDNAILDTPSNTPSENLKISVSRFINLICEQTDYLRMLAQMGIQKEKFDFINQITVEKYKNSVSKFEKMLRLMGVPNSHHEAELIVAVLDGLVFESLLMKETTNLKRIKKSLIEKYCIQ